MYISDYVLALNNYFVYFHYDNMVDIRTKIMLVDNCTKCTLYALRCSQTKIVVILHLSGNLKRADHLADGGTLTLVSAHKFCVRVCVRACVRACVCVCVCVCV